MTVSILARLRWYLIMHWFVPRWDKSNEFAPDLSLYPETWDYIPSVKRYQQRSSETRTLGAGLPDRGSWVEKQQFVEKEERAKQIHDPEYPQNLDIDTSDEYPKLGKSRRNGG